MEPIFDFEKPIAALEKKLQDLRELAQQEGVDFSAEIEVLEKKCHALIHDTYSKLTPWQKVQLSRHPNRPYTRDYVDALFPDFIEIFGDRTFGDDQALLAGFASWPPHTDQTSPKEKSTQTVLILGHQKGRTTKQKIERNFAMVKPEGYRKAIRLMEMASRFQIPIITFIDTPGAFPSVEAEERGQSQAIAESIRTMFGLQVPILTIVIGEGGSGGALAIGIGNKVLMLEYSTYSVISPEGCASILWSDAGFAEKASDRLKMNPKHLLELGIIDEIISEPLGGAHRSWSDTFQKVGLALINHLEPLLTQWKKRPDRTAQDRFEKFRSMGDIAFTESIPSPENGETDPN